MNSPVNHKKILYIITKSVWGGAGKYVYDLAVNLPKNEFEVFVAAGAASNAADGENKLAQEIKKANIPYFEIKNFKRDIGLFKDIRAFFEILKLLRKLRPDVVHVNSSKAGGIAGLAALLYKLLTIHYSLRTIFTAHGWAFHEKRPKWQNFLIRLFSKITVLFYDTIICVSEFDRQSALKNNIAKPQKLITIHNGINAQKTEFLTKEQALTHLARLVGHRMSDNKMIIGTIGEFTKNKGQKYLIEAIKLLPASYSLLTFIIGWGEEKRNLELRIRNYELGDKIMLIDNLSPAAPYLKAFDIFVLPSIKEGLPYTLLEAGLAELPVIATDVGGNPEIIENGKTGILIPPANSEALANAIEKLIKNESLRKTLAQNLHQKILNEFSFGRMLKQTIELYKY